MASFSAICVPNIFKSWKLSVLWERLALFSHVIFSMLLFQGNIFTLVHECRSIRLMG